MSKCLNGHALARRAFVMTSNDVMVAVLTKAGYRLVGLTEIRDYEAYDMVFQRDTEEW